MVRFAAPVVSDVHEVPRTAEDEASRVLFGDHDLFDALMAWNAEGNPRLLFNRVLVEAMYYLAHLADIDEEQDGLDDEASVDDEDDEDECGCSSNEDSTSSFVDYHSATTIIEDECEANPDSSDDGDVSTDDEAEQEAVVANSSVDDDDSVQETADDQDSKSHATSKDESNANLVVEKDGHVDSNDEGKVVHEKEDGKENCCDIMVDGDESESMDWDPVVEPRGVSFAFDISSIVCVVPTGADDRACRALGGSYKEATKLAARNSANGRRMFDLVLAELLLAAEEGFSLKPQPKEDVVEEPDCWMDWEPVAEPCRVSFAFNLVSGVCEVPTSVEDRAARGNRQAFSVLVQRNQFARVLDDLLGASDNGFSFLKPVQKEVAEMPDLCVDSEPAVVEEEPRHVSFAINLVTVVWEVPTRDEDRAARGNHLAFSRLVQRNRHEEMFGPVLGELLREGATGICFMKPLPKEVVEMPDFLVDSEPADVVDEPRRVSFAFDLVTGVCEVPMSEEDRASRVFGGSYKAFSLMARRNRHERRFASVLEELLVEGKTGFSLRALDDGLADTGTGHDGVVDPNTAVLAKMVLDASDGDPKPNSCVSEPCLGVNELVDDGATAEDADNVEDDSETIPPPPRPARARRGSQVPLRRSARIATQARNQQAIGSIMVKGKRRSARLVGNHD